MYENDCIPDSKEEIATRSLVSNHHNISHLADKFLDLDPNAQVGLLLGRDSGNVLFSEILNDKAHFVHHTALGFAVVGSICHRDKKAYSTRCKTLRTHVSHDHFSAKLALPKIPDSIFTLYNDDEMPGLSVEDKKFISIVDNNVIKNDAGNLQIPLPFKDQNVSFPDNRESVYRRQRTTLSRLSKYPTKLNDSLDFMSKLIQSNHVEQIKAEDISCERKWFLPIFPVIHPKKLKLRLVFDSAASFSGVSLNSKLLQGPDYNNSLHGVLLRFREKEVGFVADIQSMFHCFHVPEDQRNFMRFFWFKDNNPDNPLVQFRVNVHIFGNKSSPSVAIAGLRKAADTLTNDSDPVEIEAKNYISKGFYVDDGLGCADNVRDAVKILTTARSTLDKFNIRLHKICSNRTEVLNSFPESEVENFPVNKDFDSENLFPRTLGVSWNNEQDYFMIKTCLPNRPFTKIGVVSTVNSVFDPLGFVSPVVLGGRLVQRAIMPPRAAGAETQSYDWDDPLPSEYESIWNKWKLSVQELEKLKITRCFTPSSFGRVFSVMHQRMQ